jgi:hypothetical protein
MMTARKLTLDDLNNDLSLLDTASDKEILALNEEANSNSDYPLAGPVRYLLNARANTIAEAKTKE